MELRYSLTYLFVAASLLTFGWGPDVLVDNTGPGANISTVQAANGTIYIAVPDPVPNDNVAVRFFTSSDQGVTWTASPHSGTGTGVPVRARLVASGSAVWCAYLVDDLIHVVDLATGVVNQYTDYNGEDFDVVMSSTGWMYLYVQVMGDTDIRRAGTNDAGATWAGNTALVTGNGADPRLSISAGDTVIVNYYGPVMSDEPKSIVRQGMYFESSPGTLSVSGIGFDDIITDTSIDKWQYQSVQNGGVVWTIWSQGTVSRDIRAMISTDGGDSYGTPIDVFASTVDDEFGFHATPRMTPDNVGMDIVFERYPTGALTDQVYHSVALSSSPGAFSMIEEVSENSPRPFGMNMAPQVVVMNNGSAGVAWVGTDISGTVSTYWDSDPLFSSVDEQVQVTVSMYPNPTDGMLNLQGLGKDVVELVIYDALGNIMKRSSTLFMNMSLDVTGLPAGTYFLQMRSATGSQQLRFVRS